MGSWGKIGVQRDFWVKNGVWGNGCAKGLFGLKMGFGGKWACKGTWIKNVVLGEIGVQKDFWVKIWVWGKWVCKGTFG